MAGKQNTTKESNDSLNNGMGLDTDAKVCRVDELALRHSVSNGDNSGLENGAKVTIGDVSVSEPATKVKSSHGGDEDLDNLLKPLGGFGKFQVLNLFYISIIVIICSFSELGFVFTTAELKHRCLVAECETEGSPYDAGQPWLSSALPELSGGYDSCRRFTSRNSTDDTCSATSFTENLINCDNFIYETEEWTIVREDWGLQCDDDKWKVTLIGSLNNAGQMIGAFYVGYLADRFGRKIVLVCYALLVATLGTIKSFSVNYTMMIIFEFIEASQASFLFNGPFVLAMEIVDPSKRVLAGAIISTVYPIGEMLLGLIQYLTFDWRTTLRIMYIPFFLLISYFWLLPESIRWLINNNRRDDALAILKKIASMNGKEVTMEMEKKLYSINAQKGDNKSQWKAFTETWKSKIMRRRCLVCWYLWLVVMFVYFGMAMTSVSISSDKFLNFILSSAIEIPAYITIFFLLDRIGRRPVLATSFFVCGIGCALSAYVPEDDSWAWAKLVLYLIGKFGASISFMTMDVYTTELFPTAIRSSALGLGSMFGKLATILAPQMPLLADFYKPLPLLIFCCLSLIAGALSFNFPETLNVPLPDTVEEAENLGKKKKKELKEGA